MIQVKIYAEVLKQNNRISPKAVMYGAAGLI